VIVANKDMYVRLSEIFGQRASPLTRPEQQQPINYETCLTTHLVLRLFGP
jgi:hypothetical protein